MAGWGIYGLADVSADHQFISVSIQLQGDHRYSPLFLGKCDRRCACRHPNPWGCLVMSVDSCGGLLRGRRKLRVRRGDLRRAFAGRWQHDLWARFSRGMSLVIWESPRFPFLGFTYTGSSRHWRMN